MIYDPVNRVLLPPAPPAPALTFKKDIWVRATDEEAETIEQVLSQQSLRKQRIYAEAQYLDHADPLYGELYAGFVQAFGKERADQLLAALRVNLLGRSVGSATAAAQSVDGFHALLNGLGSDAIGRENARVDLAF